MHIKLIANNEKKLTAKSLLSDRAKEIVRCIWFARQEEEEGGGEYRSSTSRTCL